MDGERFDEADQPFVADLLKRMVALQGKPGVQLHVVEHSDWCGIWTGGLCCCSPVVRSPNRKERRALKKRAKH